MVNPNDQSEKNKQTKMSDQDAYKRNETHDPSAAGHPQSSDAYERNLDSSLTRDQQSPMDEEE